MTASASQRSSGTMAAQRHSDVGIAAVLKRAAVSAFVRMAAWQSAADDRQRLRGLTDRELRDVGLTRDQTGKAASTWSALFRGR